jgi:hypothetical protein
MSALKQEKRTENITLAGVIDGANVNLNYVRENEKTIQQITVHANEQAVDGRQPRTMYISWQAGSISINAYNCELDDVPMELIEKLVQEIQEIQDENS